MEQLTSVDMLVLKKKKKLYIKIQKHKSHNEMKWKNKCLTLEQWHDYTT